MILTSQTKVTLALQPNERVEILAPSAMPNEIYLAKKNCVIIDLDSLVEKEVMKIAPEYLIKETKFRNALSFAKGITEHIFLFSYHLDTPLSISIDTVVKWLIKDSEDFAIDMLTDIEFARYQIDSIKNEYNILFVISERHLFNPLYPVFYVR